MKHLLQIIDEEPLSVFTHICKEYESTNKPVSDHHIHSSTYFGEAALKALVTAGLIERESGGRLSLYQYKPTEAGLAQYKSLMAEQNQK